jgi:hypothetical protein
MKTNTTQSIESLLALQNTFSSLFYDKDKMSFKEKEEMLKTLTLAMHYEVSEIVSSCNFKVFDKTNYVVDKDKIVYNSIDVFRYLLAIMNLYDIKADDFLSSFNERDIHLKLENNIVLPKDNQKVIVVDIDDVICDFRRYFNSWLREKYNIDIDPNSTSYYSSKEVKDHGYSPEGVFETFISENQLLNIPVISNMVKVLELAKKDNVYIQLLTSRPDSNLKCKYQTYSWLYNNNIPFDNIGFAAEKYIWVAKKDFYLKGNLAVAIDDSPKHAMEYATHDIHVIVPKTHYNKDISHQNITHVTDAQLKELSF